MLPPKTFHSIVYMQPLSEKVAKKWFMNLNGSFDGASVLKWRLDHRSVETDESWDILNSII